MLELKTMQTYYSILGGREWNTPVDLIRQKPKVLFVKKQI